MIFALVGTHEQPFARLIAALDALPENTPCIVQHGHSLMPKHGTAHAFMPFTEVERLMQQAQVIVTHAGTGTVMLALSLGKVPVVMPRLARFGEHVDDHQMELIETLRPLNLIVPCLPGDDLAAKISEASQMGAQRRIEPDAALVDYLNGLVLASAA